MTGVQTCALPIFFRIVPESTNVVAIPEIRMSVYDPAQKKYTSLTYPSTTLTVRPGIDTEPQAAFFTNSAGKSLAPASSTSEGQFPLRLTLGSSASAAPWIASLWFRLGFAFPLVAWIGIGVGRIVFVRWRNDPERMRRRNLARSIADARAQLDESIRTNDSREIVDSLQAVLAREMNAIVSLPPGSITAQNVRNALSSSGVESGHLDEIEEIMITLENTRFAPSMGKIDLLSLRSRMDSAIVGVKGAVDL